MRKSFLFLVAVIVSTNLFAQNKTSIRETFESNKWQWDEFYEKSCSAGIEDGFLVIKNSNSETSVRSVVSCGYRQKLQDHIKNGARKNK